MGVARKAAPRGIALRNKVELFLLEKNHPLATRFSDLTSVLQLACLADIFAEVNDLNTSMQGLVQTLARPSGKPTTFKSKLTLCTKKTEGRKTASFQVLNACLKEQAVPYTTVKTIVEHSDKLIVEYCHYTTKMR